MWVSCRALRSDPPAGKGKGAEAACLQGPACGCGIQPGQCCAGAHSVLLCHTSSHLLRSSHAQQFHPPRFSLMPACAVADYIGALPSRGPCHFICCKRAAVASALGCGEQVEKLMAKASGRRYLLESAEFWAMREMVELSKGAFSSLPSWLSAIVQHASDLTTSSLLAQHS